MKLSRSVLLGGAQSGMLHVMDHGKADCGAKVAKKPAVSIYIRSGEEWPEDILDRIHEKCRRVLEKD